MAKKGFFGEFKEFISRGNVIDMAVGVVIGGAFGKIVTSLVNDIIMPAISMITGSGSSVADLKYVITEAVKSASKEVLKDGTVKLVIVLNDEENPTPIKATDKVAASYTSAMFPVVTAAQVRNAIDDDNIESVNLVYSDCSVELVYRPTNGQIVSMKQVVKYAKCCIPTGETIIYAKPLSTQVKIFTAWDNTNYMFGKEGDYIATRSDDFHDIYVVENNIFHKTYEECV